MTAVLQTWGQDAEPATAAGAPPLQEQASESAEVDVGAKPLESACRPACRSGFTCVERECVSSCNPLCPQGHVCTDAAECVPDPAGPTLPPVVLPTSATAPARPSPVQARSGLVIAARIGLLLFGSGTLTTRSRAGDGFMELGDQESVGFDDQSRVLLELDALFHLVPAFRLGLGAFFVPSVGVEADGSSLDEDWGRELAPVAVFEGVFGANVAGTLRAFIGANILFPGGDLQDSMDDIEETCSALSVEGYGCVYELGPFLGLTLGAGGGVVGHVSEHIALRGDLMVQYLSSSGPSVDAAGPNSETLRVDTSWSTTRLWALFGLEY